MVLKFADMNSLCVFELTRIFLRMQNGLTTDVPSIPDSAIYQEAK